MEQKELRELEKRCIQEEPPFCTAACPLHVDVRLFVRQIREGKWDAACATLKKTMPFAGILGRICDHPCQLECKRREVGDPIAIGALERACVQLTGRGGKVRCLPGNGRAVAVVGSGMSGIAAAWDLVRKGYAVTVFSRTDELGGWLLGLPEKRLPREAILDQISELQQLGVRFDLREDAAANLLETALRRFEAVCLDLGGIDYPADGHALDPDGAYGVRANPVTLQSAREASLFLAGLACKRAHRSPVLEAAQGRAAAASIDRHLQRVSLTAAREGEGPRPTRLYTSLAGVEPLPAAVMADPEEGYSKEEAVQEAGRCLHCECLECVKTCLYLERFAGYPKRYARQIYNNESIVAGHRTANKLINSCSLCRLCEIVCPEDFSMADLCRQARKSMVDRGKMPPSAHEFALDDLRFSTSEQFALARSEPGRDPSRFAFFPGCQLSASLPGRVQQIYEHLRGALGGGVGLVLYCCGAPALWAARDDLCRDTWRWLEERWRALGAPTLILACPTCTRMFKQHAPHIPIESLWQILEKIGLPGPAAASGPPWSGRSPLAVHDPCTARGEREMRQSVRRLLSRLGCAIEELPYSGFLTECCGYGGLMAAANPALAREVAARRARQSPSDYVTYCAMCRDSLSASGKRVVHILDLIYPSPGGEPPARKGPGWSQRQESRERLKTDMLARLWGERPPEMEEHRKIVLEIPPEVRELMEERRILVEDIQRVIHHAEKEGRRFFQPSTGRWLACFRPVRVTFWVEYSRGEKGFRIHSVYSHRMQILADTKP
ncbi:MAG: pyridine nucleotide-disulfide oxidoreductase/dicluster-binding protein [bacterium]